MTHGGTTLEALHSIDIQNVCVLYQPIFRAADGTMCGCEALARLSDPARGLVGPSEFIPDLEESGQIAELDTFVLNTTCSNWARARKAGIKMTPVSLNFSRRDFSLMNVPQVVSGTAQRYDIAPSFLRIEVTESCIAQSEGKLDQQLTELRSLGFEVWMDDFGSGYSSLAQLGLHNFDVIKLDMAFLSHFESDGSRKLLAAVLAMLKGLGVRTLMEGVETEEQYHYVRLRGAELIQGFYFAQPLTFEELCRVLNKRQP